MKYYTITAAVALFVASIGMAAAASDYGTTPGHKAKHVRTVRSAENKNRVFANGRCGGISYGTGARSCGTMTGGPVGGLAGRN